MKRYFFIFFLVFFCNKILGDKVYNSFETLNLTFPARYFALGGAGVALCDDISSVFINSSRLVQLKSFSFCAGGSIQFDDAYSTTVAASIPMPLGVFAGFLSWFNYGPAEIRTSDTLEPDYIFYPSDIIAGIGFGSSLFNFFSYGINLKYIQGTYSQKDIIYAFAADLNTHFDIKFIKGFQAGFTVNNLGIIPDINYKNNSLPLVFVAGFAYPVELETPVAGLYDIKTALDLEVNTLFNIRVLSGIEWCWYHIIPDMHITLRTGFSFPVDTAWFSMLRLGAGLEWKTFSLDYGCGFFQDLGFIHRITLSYRSFPLPEKRFVRITSEKTIKRTLQEIDNVIKKSSSITNSSPKEYKKEEEEYDFEEE